jgi:two-component system sensor histidine kinase QseC
MKPITPCLWFESNAEEAANFYVSLFPRSKIKGKTYYTENTHMPAGTLLTVDLELFGQDFIILNGGALPNDSHKHNHSVSFMAMCETQAEIDDVWDKILKNGGTPEQCGWIRDQYGVMWQVAPVQFRDWLQDKNKNKVNAFMQEMMSQVKFDLAKLEKAFNEG